MFAVVLAALTFAFVVRFAIDRQRRVCIVGDAMLTNSSDATTKGDEVPLVVTAVPEITTQTLRVNAKAWARWNAARAKKAAAEKAEKLAREACGLPPDAKTFAEVLSITLVPAIKASVLVTDAKGNPIGKASLYWNDAKFIPSFFAVKYS